MSERKEVAPTVTSGAASPSAVALLNLPLGSVPAELVSTVMSLTNPDPDTKRTAVLVAWSAFRTKTASDYRLPAFYVGVLPRNAVAASDPSRYDLYEIAAQGDKHDVDVYWVGGTGSCQFVTGTDPDPSKGATHLVSSGQGIALDRCRYVERKGSAPGRSTNYAWVEFDGPFCVLLAIPYHGKPRPTPGGGLQDGDGSPPPPVPGGDYSGNSGEN